DDERRGRRDALRRERRGHELVAPVRPNRNVDAGELPHDARPRARRDDDGPRLEATRCRGDAAHAIAPRPPARPSKRPDAVVTPLTRSPRRMKPVTSCPCLMITPQSRARPAIAV